MPKTLGVAIIGTGTIANQHARSLSRHEPARMVAVFDVLGDRAREFGDRWQIPNVTKDLSDVLSRDDVDAVIVSTPPYAHMEATIAALEAGKHVLCEKPFALDPAEAERMTETAERTGKFLSVASARQRCGAAMRRAHDLAASGTLGISGRDLAALAARRAGGAGGHDTRAPVSDRARTSARNRFAGIVTEVVRDTVMAQVEMICGQHRIVSLMSREAADALGLEPGVLADAVVKATTVVVETSSRPS